MLALWLTAFIFGVTLARAALPAAPVVFTASLAFLVIHRRHLSRRSGWQFGIAACGLAWGGAHAAPPACIRLVDAEVVARNGIFPGGGPLIIGSGGQRYEAYGDQAEAVRGRVNTTASRRLFSPCLAFFAASVTRKAAPNSLLQRAGSGLRQIVMQRTYAFSPATRAFVRSVVIGDKTRLDPQLVDAFKKTGLYHLLVVSGQHVTLISMLLAAAIRAPLQLAYALRLLGPSMWRQVAAATSLIVAVAALVYAAGTGMSAASQRSALLFVVWQVSHVFFGSLPVHRRLLLAAVAQTLAFPIGFVSEASLMSWCAYLLVLRDVRDDVTSSWRVGVGAALRLQGRMMIVTAAVFGQLSLLGLVANGIFVALFSFVLVLTVILVAWPAAPWAPLLIGAQQSFVLMLTHVASLCDRWPWLSLQPEQMQGWVRWSLAGVGAVLVLNTCRILTIRAYESD